MEWTSNGLGFNLEGGLVPGGRSVPMDCHSVDVHQRTIMNAMLETLNLHRVDSSPTG